MGVPNTRQKPNSSSHAYGRLDGLGQDTRVRDLVLRGYLPLTKAKVSHGKKYDREKVQRVQTPLLSLCNKLEAQKGLHDRIIFTAFAVSCTARKSKLVFLSAKAGGNRSRAWECLQAVNYLFAEVQMENKAA